MMSSNSQTKAARKEWKARIEAGETVLCALCGEPVPAKSKGNNRLRRGGKGSISVDHIKPLAAGGTSERDNLQPTHARCNYEKGASYVF